MAVGSFGIGGTSILLWVLAGSTDLMAVFSQEKRHFEELSSFQ